MKSFHRTLLTCLFSLILLVTLKADPEPALSTIHLRCEAMENPLLVDTTAPRFSWQLFTTDHDVHQIAYQLRVQATNPDGSATGDALEGPRVSSDQSQWAELTGFKARAKTRYLWQVRIWDNHGHDSQWSEPAIFEVGLLDEKWPAAWVADGISVARDSVAPARYFRKNFVVPPGTVKARLYLSAGGIVEPWLNGKPVSADHFTPGWPDYQKRFFYVAYDVTKMLQDGPNALGLILGDGWYSGTLLTGAQAGPMPVVSAFIELTDAKGKVTTVSTGPDMLWAHGPVTAQGIYYGEDHDARLADPAWCDPSPGVSPWPWHPVQLQGNRGISLTARLSPPVRSTEEIRPVGLKEIKPGVWLYDLGQNMVGWARLKLKAPAGTEVRLRFAEMLEADGSIHTANLRQARAQAIYHARGGTEESWEPQFTYFGFRYVEVTGVPQPTADTITGIVVHTDLERIGTFECSSPLLNKLYANTVWSQRDNFLEVPTDCPQRNERLGWTGDAQVFAHTASYNYDSGNFYRQWLAAVRDSYRDDPGGQSGFGDVAPDIGFRRGSAGWGDAAVIIPWITWLHTADRRVLEENFAAIQRWVDDQTRDNPDGIRRSRRSYGDWLAPGFKPSQAPTPYELIATAYYAHVTDLAGRIAALLGNTNAATRNQIRFEEIRDAFNRKYVTADGRVTSDEQTAYLLALGFNLIPEALLPRTLAQLDRKFAEANNHLATGFLGTPLVAPVLSANGRSDLAYAVVNQETYPGWLFSVKNGATTIWERWDSWTPEKGFNPEGMNSFNHYAYGSIVGWFYDTVAGLKPRADGAGWKQFDIAPTPGGGLTQAAASLKTPYGLATSAWKMVEGRFELSVTVPPNTQATVSLPAASLAAVTESGHPLADLSGISELRQAGQRTRFNLPSGSYHFSVSAQP